MKNFKNKSILVTGSCGTIGSKLIDQLIDSTNNEINKIIGIDNNESSIFFQDQQYIDNPKISFYVSDIRDQYALKRVMKDIDIVFHAAALKHVVLCERSPEQAINTNIKGVENVVNAAIDNNVERVIFTSSDKAVNPTNVMGASKLMGERLITAANNIKKTSDTIFTSTRFGNVLGSSGSVVPIFTNQIKKGGPVTLTSKEMSRFVMNIDEAIDLVLSSALIAKGGEIFVTKMNVINIKHLAIAMIELLAPKFGFKSKDIEIIEIGTKPGEKNFEELMNEEEIRRTIELDDFFAILPAFRDIYKEADYDYKNVINFEVNEPYNSRNESALSINQVKNYLENKQILTTIKEDTDKRYWPGDKEKFSG